MIDFKDRGLYKGEKRGMQKFLNDKLQTVEERDNTLSFDSDDGGGGAMLDVSSFLDGDAVDFGSDDGDSFFSGWGSDDSGWGDSGKQRKADIRNERLHETGVWWKDILFSPFVLFYYVGKMLVYDFPDKEEWRGVLESLNKITSVTAVLSGILWALGFNFIISLQFQTIASVLMFGISFAIIKFVYEEKKEETKEDANDEFGDFGFDSFEDSDEGLGFGTADDFGFLNDSFDDIIGKELEGIEEEIETDGADILPPSPIETSSLEMFYATLLDVFKRNSMYQGREITERRKLLESFSGYIVTNDKKFGSWRIIQERSVEFNNICYSIYRGLCQIQNQFLKDDEKMVVHEVKSNPLLFKVSVELPPYFKEKMVVSSIKEIENFLRKDGNDVAVAVNVEYYRGMFTFKLMRLDNKNLISIGDILRFYNEETKSTPLEEFADDDKGLPMLLGLRNYEYPYIIDLEDNTSGAIVGGSNSGKSWLTFTVMFNLTLANDYNNAQFIIFDKKNAPFWNQFAKFPHVLGYHTDVYTYLEKFREIYKEVDRRKQLMNELNAENLKSYRKRLRKNKDYEGLKALPVLTIVIDEITSTMGDLKTYYEQNDDKASYDEFRNILNMITQEGRFVGVRLLSIGQRAIDTSIPRNVMANSSFKFGMRMDIESEFKHMFGDEVQGIPKPAFMGMGLARTMGEKGIQSIKTVTVGGTDEDQIIALIRVLALEWVRRSIGLDDIINPPPAMNLPLCYNRDKFVRESLQDLEEGRIISKQIVDPSASLNPTMVSGKKGEHDMSTTYEPFDDWDNESLIGGNANSTKKGNDRLIPVVDEDEADELGYEDDFDFGNDELQEVIDVESPFEINDSPIDFNFDVDDDIEEDDFDYDFDDVVEDEIVESVDFKNSESIDFTLEDEEPVIEIPKSKIPQYDKSELFLDMEDDDDEEDLLMDLDNLDKVVVESPKPVVIPKTVVSEQMSEVSSEQSSAKPDISSLLAQKRSQKAHIEEKTVGGVYRNANPNEPTQGQQMASNGVKRQVRPNIEKPKTTVATQPSKSVVSPSVKSQFANEEERKVGVGVQPKRNSGMETVMSTPATANRNTENQKTSHSEKDGLSVKFVTKAPITEHDEPNLTVKQYILKYGQKDGIRNRKILKEELEAVYPKHKIQKAVNMLSILEDGEWYITTL